MSKRTYTVSTHPVNGHPTITVHTSLNNIPFNVWKCVGVLAGASFDNEEGHVVYEFLLPDNLKKAEECLQGALWEKVSFDPRGKV